MEQYQNLLRAIKEKGTIKPAARENMPGTQSLFGYQLRHNLADGFPLLTTKKMFWKGVVVELLWFLRGDTNIKFLVDNGVNIWNEDAYNYYVKICKKYCPDKGPCGYEGFIASIQVGDLTGWSGMPTDYRLGDCGFQYGKVWRDWEGYKPEGWGVPRKNIDQIKNLIEGLKSNPESRRHIVTAIDPAHDTDLALYWCHAMFQFNCRPLTPQERQIHYKLKIGGLDYINSANVNVKDIDADNIPKYYLDCQLYQRSADVVLGVPFNIASYALLTEILAKICNMIPGEFVHTFGDVHIYDNHNEAVEEQLSRTPTALPKLNLKPNDAIWVDFTADDFGLLKIPDFTLENYNPQSAIKAELSTGLKK